MAAESAQAQRPARRGASLSDKQVAYSVRDGQQVTAYLDGHEPVTGYVYGADDYHWALVTPDLGRYLIHKSTHLMFGREDTYATEPNHDGLEQLVGPFRAWVLAAHFGRQPASRGEPA